MDWVAFFENNSQSLFTLAGVFLGSLITFLINYQNNRFQAKEHDKDREEKRKEASVHAKEKLIERDIQKIMDSIELILELSSKRRGKGFQFRTIIDGKESGLLTHEEANVQARLLYDTFSVEFTQVNQSLDMMSRLVRSFEDPQIISAYNTFVDVMEKYLKQELENNTYKEFADGFDMDNIIWPIVTRQAGSFHRTLRDKLISLRDS